MFITLCRFIGSKILKLDTMISANTTLQDMKAKLSMQGFGLTIKMGPVSIPHTVKYQNLSKASNSKGKITSGYRWHHLGEPVLMARANPIMTEFSIPHKFETRETQGNTTFQSIMNAKLSQHRF